MSENHWYPHYPGDYGRDTADLSLIQHGAYRLLLDHYYATGGPLPAEKAAIYRICRAFADAEQGAVDFVLGRFFSSQEDGYHNSRADRELAKSAELHERRSHGGLKTAAKRWGSSATSPATRSASSSRVGNPQPHPQPQKEKKNPAAKPAPLPDPRHRPFFDFSFQLAQGKFMASPTWGGRHAKKLSVFLREHPQVAQAEWERRYSFFLQSTDRFYRQQHGCIEFFTNNFDKFMTGPILERNGSNEASNRAEQRTDRNLRAAGLL